MRRTRSALFGAVLSAALALGGAGLSAGSAQADEKPVPPASSNVSGKSAKPDVKPGSKDAKATESKGASKLVKTDKNGKLVGATNAAPQAGYVTGVDFTAPYNYCWKQLTYTPVKNTTTSTQYVQVQVYNQGTYRQYYYSVAAGSTIYPAFYGVEGAYYAYLYVWNGSYYSYDEYWSSNNTCNVSVTRTYNYGGWVQLAYKNNGTAYATQVSTELAPYAANEYSPYTGGPKYDYPAAGGATLYRWFYVGYSPYGVSSYTDGSWHAPKYFTGDL